MATSAILNVAIGLVFMFAVLSLIGTAINEFIATRMKLRAATLRTSLEQMLDHPQLYADFYNHGLIDGVMKAIGGDHVSYISGATFAGALIGALDPNKPIPGFADAKSAIENLPDCNIRDVLLTQLAQANGEIDQLRDGISKYFDTAMDRVSGVYQRQIKLIALIVGAVVVCVINADALAVGAALWNDPTLRAEMVESARHLQPSATPASPETLEALSGQIGSFDAQIVALPIGWPDSQWQKNKMSIESLPSGSGLLWLISKILGLALTMIAISLGAPFWFDTLSQFMNLRGSGPKPARADPTND